METDLLNNSSTLQHGKLSTLEAIRATMGKKKKKKKSKSKKSLKKSDKPIKKAISPNKISTLQISPLPSPVTDSQIPNIIIQMGDDPENCNNIVRLKDKLTDKELRFVSFYMTGEYNQEQAMNLAGYGDYHPAYKRLLASRIIARHESQAEDHRNICRVMGAGEVAVIRGLLDLAKTAKGEMVRLNAWSQLSKILGLTKEQLEGAGGVTIIFEGAGTPGATASLPGAPLPPSQGEIKVLPASNKPMMITK